MAKKRVTARKNDTNRSEPITKHEMQGPTVEGPEPGSDAHDKLIREAARKAERNKKS